MPYKSDSSSTTSSMISVDNESSKAEPTDCCGECYGNKQVCCDESTPMTINRPTGTGKTELIRCCSQCYGNKRTLEYQTRINFLNLARNRPASLKINGAKVDLAETPWGTNPAHKEGCPCPVCTYSNRTKTVILKILNRGLSGTILDSIERGFLFTRIRQADVSFGNYWYREYKKDSSMNIAFGFKIPPLISKYIDHDIAIDREQRSRNLFEIFSPATTYKPNRECDKYNCHNVWELFDNVNISFSTLLTLLKLATFIATQTNRSLAPYYNKNSSHGICDPSCTNHCVCTGQSFFQFLLKLVTSIPSIANVKSIKDYNLTTKGQALVNYPRWYSSHDNPLDPTKNERCGCTIRAKRFTEQEERRKEPYDPTEIHPDLRKSIEHLYKHRYRTSGIQLWEEFNC